VKIAPRLCEWCTAEYTPNSARQRRCEACRATPPPGRCACGSLISGRARWGAEWGGECDRAEAKVAAVMGALGGAA
jgi:hypothetical protein